jgi:hypothetical protein
MKIPELFSNIAYVGQAEGDRKTYYVFQGRSRYLVVSPNAQGGFNMNLVDPEAREVIRKRFRGKKVTTRLVSDTARRPDLFPRPLEALNVLYVMVALGDARKLKQREGKAMVFKIS